MLCVTIVYCMDGWVGVLTFALGQDYVCDLLDYFWTDKTDLACSLHVTVVVRCCSFVEFSSLGRYRRIECHRGRSQRQT